MTENYGRFRIADLNNDKPLKYEFKESREDWQLTRDAVHGELLKAIRAIDVMKGVAVAALNHSPPRTQAESEQRRREIEKQKLRSEQIGDNLSTKRLSRGGYQYSSSSSAMASGNFSPSPTSSQNEGSSNNKNKNSSSFRPPSLPVSHHQNPSSSTTNKSKSPSPNSVSFSINNNNNNNNNNNKSSTAESRRSRSESSPRMSTTDALMDTDPQLAFEAIAVSQSQLGEALEILRGDPMELERGMADGDAPPLKIIERSPAKTFYRHNDPDSPKKAAENNNGDISFASAASAAVSTRRG